MAGTGEDGLDDVDSALHRARGDQHLGDVDLIAREARADLSHGGNHGLVEQCSDIFTGIDCGLNESDDGLAVAAANGIEQGLDVGHRNLSLGRMRLTGRHCVWLKIGMVPAAVEHGRHFAQGAQVIHR